MMRVSSGRHSRSKRTVSVNERVSISAVCGSGESGYGQCSKKKSQKQEAFTEKNNKNNRLSGGAEL